MTYQSEVAMIAHEEGSGWTSSEDSLVGSPRSAARLRRWPLVVGASLVAAVAGAAIVVSRRSAGGSVSDVSASIEAAGVDDGECADAFKQCGGVKFGHKCCKLGCTCKAQSDYFHGCEPSGGLDHCSLKAGSGPFTDDAIKLAKELVIKAKDAHDAFEEAADAEEKTLIKAHALLVASQAAKTVVDDEDKDAYSGKLHDQIEATKGAKLAGMHASTLARKAEGVHDDRVKASKKLIGWLDKAEEMQKQVGGAGSEESASSSSSSSSSEASDGSESAESMQLEVAKLKEQVKAMKKKEEGSTSSSSEDETSSDEDSEGDASFEVISAD